MPHGFQLPTNTQLWTPLIAGGDLRDNRRSHLLTAIARLKPGATMEQAHAELASIVVSATRQKNRERMRKSEERKLKPYLWLIRFIGLVVPRHLRADWRQEGSGTAIPLHEYYFGGMATPLRLLLAAVAAVLLIACVNVANLSLARGAERSRELAIRAAVGAGRGRMLRQWLTESLLLALCGGGAGWLLASWGRGALVRMMPASVPRGGDVALDGWVLGFTALLSLTVGIVAALLPALQVSQRRWAIT
jgi:putative ABC transport system permease protein